MYMIFFHLNKSLLFSGRLICIFLSRLPDEPRRLINNPRRLFICQHFAFLMSYLCIFSFNSFIYKPLKKEE